MNSPCLTCTRVRNPSNCENKLCKDWQAWFIDRWDAMRAYVRAQMEQSDTVDLGVPLGGESYASPHRIQEYLERDPCDRCHCPKEVCLTPCSAKIAWSNKNSEVKQ